MSETEQQRNNGQCETIKTTFFCDLMPCILVLNEHVWLSVWLSDLSAPFRSLSSNQHCL